MQRLFIKLFLATCPVLTVLAVYFYNDPFKVLYHYDSYFPADGIQYVVLNKDYVSTETFVNNYPKYHYDSYIFGNSRSMYYYVDEWKKHIHSDKCYHFDASGESLYGIERKFQFLHSRGVPIENALIVFDAQACSITKNVGEAHIMKKDPLLSGQSKFDFQADCLKAFFDVHFLSAYLTFLFTHKVSKEMSDKLLLNNVESHYDAAVNEESFPRYEQLIAKSRDSFYAPRMHLFYKRDTVQRYSGPVIKDEQKLLFYNIKKILDENKTSYRFVISPLYDQVKFDSTDLKFLYSVFGRENVYDFSGINDITDSPYNYYENSHYRPFIANRIMDSIYKIYNPAQ
jgi:hypothetical protein